MIKKTLKVLWHKGEVRLSLVLLSLLCMTMVGTVPAFLTSSLQSILDDVFINKNAKLLINISVVTLFLFFLKGICEYIGTLCVMYSSQKMVENLQKCLFAKCLSLDYAFFTQQHHGEITALFVQDSVRIGEIFSEGFIILFTNALTALSLVYVIFSKSIYFSILFFLCVPFIGMGFWVLGKNVRYFSEKSAKISGKIESFFQQVFANIIIVKAFHTEKKEIHNLDEKLSMFWEKRWKTLKMRAIVHPLTEIVCAITILFVLILGGHRVITGAMTPGVFLSFLTSLFLIYPPVKNVMRVCMRFQEALVSAERIRHILSLPIQEEGAPAFYGSTNFMTEKDLEAQILTQDIVFRDVCFSYKNEKVLHNFSFTFSCGKTSAILGLSGSGKSTLFLLLLRLYYPQKGEILLGSTPINAFPCEMWRKNITFVGQQYGLFYTSVKENIIYGAEGAQKYTWQDAAVHACAHDFIEKLPHKYDNSVHTLSGGQGQRIAIARSFFRQSPLLLWDEATSSLDNIVQRHILDNLIKSRSQKTNIIISHNINNIKNVDNICVLHKGHFVQQGTYDDLVQDPETVAYKIIKAGEL